jgi:hypothetical protein
MTRHHKKEFMEETRINLTVMNSKQVPSAFGKGLDHFSEKQIDTTFLDKFYSVVVNI